jgi:hypothetical protein
VTAVGLWISKLSGGILELMGITAMTAKSTVVEEEVAATAKPLALATSLGVERTSETIPYSLQRTGCCKVRPIF